jgi:hypothetical protein
MKVLGSFLVFWVVVLACTNNLSIGTLLAICSIIGILYAAVRYSE